MKSSENRKKKRFRAFFKSPFISSEIKIFDRKYQLSAEPVCLVCCALLCSHSDLRQLSTRDWIHAPVASSGCGGKVTADSGLRLPSQRQSVVTNRPVANDSAW